MTENTVSRCSPVQRNPKRIGNRYIKSRAGGPYEIYPSKLRSKENMSEEDKERLAEARYKHIEKSILGICEAFRRKYVKIRKVYLKHDRDEKYMKKMESYKKKFRDADTEKENEWMFKNDIYDILFTENKGKNPKDREIRTIRALRHGYDILWKFATHFDIRMNDEGSPVPVPRTDGFFDLPKYVELAGKSDNFDEWIHAVSLVN